MVQEKIVNVECGAVFLGTPLREMYIAKTTSIVIQKSVHDNGVRCVLNTVDIQFENQDAAQQFAQEKQQEISANLSSVANPYLVYSVQAEDNLLHPCRSVYVKYGIIMPTVFNKSVPVILPKKHTSIRYDATCTGLRDVQWISCGGKLPDLQFQVMPENVKLPIPLSDQRAKYAFLNCAFFFEEAEFAQDFRNEMLMQQALRRYALYKKIEKSW